MRAHPQSDGKGAVETPGGGGAPPGPVFRRGLSPRDRHGIGRSHSTNSCAARAPGGLPFRGRYLRVPVPPGPKIQAT